MKISELQAQMAKQGEPDDFEVKDQTGKPWLASDGSPVTFGVYGPESPAIKAANRKRREILRQGRRTGGEPLTQEDIEDLDLDVTVAGVGRWRGVEGDDGKAAPCTPANVKTVLQAAEHILLQVETRIYRHSSFSTPASKNSSSTHGTRRGTRKRSRPAAQNAST